MSNIKPFRAVHYNTDKIVNPSLVMAPPYDVIKGTFQDTLYGRHEANIIRLILAKRDEGDVNGNEKYDRAAAHYKEWLGNGTLVRDEKPALYYYTQEYEGPGGDKLTRKGFITLKKLEEFGKGGMHPHEKTLSGPKADRLKLMKACSANFSCIFSLYSEPDTAPEYRVSTLIESAATGAPFIVATDDDGVINRVWIVSDEEVVKSVVERMESKPLFIADGHHRYETALNYRNFRREADAKDSGADYVMMYLSSMDDEGMTIFPTHRVVHSLPLFVPDLFLEKCEEYFFIDEFFFDESMEEMARERFLSKLKDATDRSGGGDISFGLYMAGRDSYYLLTVKGPEILDDFFGPNVPEVYRRLDVTVLHSLILNNILEITQEAQEKQTNIRYVKNIDEALGEAKDGECQAVFIMNSTRIDQVKAVAEAGLVMPQKSTYFYPKLLTGLTVNSLDGDE